MFVTHGTDLHALVPLSVSLCEELHHDAVCPLTVNLQRLGGVAEVGTVDHVLKNLEDTCWSDSAQTWVLLFLEDTDMTKINTPVQ